MNLENIEIKFKVDIDYTKIKNIKDMINVE